MGIWNFHTAGARTFACVTRGTIDERHNNSQTVALISDVDLAVKCNPTASRKNSAALRIPAQARGNPYGV